MTLLYSFFDYKYNIPGYTGQDYDDRRILFTIFCLAVIPVLVILLRNTKEQQVNRFLKVVSIGIAALEIIKIVWESVWDVRTGHGLNFGGIMPLDTCSLFIYTMLGAAWGKGRVREYSLAWLATLGLVGGLANALFLNALKFYPFYTFGAFHSMTFHAMMIFTALLITATGVKPISWYDLNRAFLTQVLFSVIPITLDYLLGWDYMLYRNAGGVPLVQDLAETFSQQGLSVLTTVLMLLLYFSATALVVAVYRAVSRCRRKHRAEPGA